MTQAADGGPGFVILTCMRGAAGSGASYALTCPVDTPFLPADFVPRLIATLEAGDPNAPAVAVCDGRVHGLHALWPVSRCADLDMLLDDPAKRKVELLHRELGSTPCIFDSGEGAPPFLNLNRPDDIERAQRFADSGA